MILQNTQERFVGKSDVIFDVLFFALSLGEVKHLYV